MKIVHGFYTQGKESHMFSGFLIGDGSGNWCGSLFDAEGQSRIFAYEYDAKENEIRFHKQYIKHDLLPHAFVTYFLSPGKSNPSVCLGVWKFPEADYGEGSVRCVIVDVDEKVFYEDARQLLKSVPPKMWSESDQKIAYSFMQRNIFD